MISWYKDYWAQTWYKNTFLVRRPNQIAQVIDHDHEWNNIYDSGCNFSCLAMMVGIDPARLASELSSHNYFFADSSLPATYLAGKSGGLVWDQNAPHRGLKAIKLKNIWHPRRQRRVTIALRYVKTSTSRSYEEGRKLVAAIRDGGRHVICGPKDHSHLVAGTVDGDFFVWDPDDSETSVERNLAGEFTLRELFHECEGEPIEFWEYQVDVV